MAPVRAVVFEKNVKTPLLRRASFRKNDVTVPVSKLIVQKTSQQICYKCLLKPTIIASLAIFSIKS